MPITESVPEQSTLGKKTVYDSRYDADKLFPIPREIKRQEIGIAGALPFYGVDIWNHYEVSWLNAKGKPVVAMAEIEIGCESLNIIESKSMKLYFNSFNNTKFAGVESVKKTILRDINARIGGDSVKVNIIPLTDCREDKLLTKMDGISIDELDVTCSAYHIEPRFLSTEAQVVEETLCTDLLKSNCLVTNQPDWCSVQIIYFGKKINREGLLRYIVSFRDDNEFHEQCIEKIFMHIMQYCKPKKLTVYGRSTRRGGIDINAYRSTEKINAAILNMRLCRQ